MIEPRPREVARAAERRTMLREIEAEVRETAHRTGRFALSPRVAAAIETVPRHEFVSLPEAASAYVNAPLPIGYGQTISQPYIVAIMTELADVGEDDVVLDVGTGCGYQAAVLAEVAKQVYTIELVPELAAEARERLARLGYANVEVREGDGWEGWAERGPFDAIVVTAAAEEVPPALVAQLKPGGRMVIPVGSSFFGQELVVIRTDADGRVQIREVLPVRFVPLRHRASAG